MKKIVLIISLSILLFTGCSSSSESTKENLQNNKQEIYVFDDVTGNDTLSNRNDSLDVSTIASVDSIKVNSLSKYVVQVGAFTTEGKAKKFVKLNQSKIVWQMNISYSNSVDLFVVQLPAFSNRAKAERVRNKLWEMKTFNDAFIITK